MVIIYHNFANYYQRKYNKLSDAIQLLLKTRINSAIFQPSNQFIRVNLNFNANTVAN